MQPRTLVFLLFVLPLFTINGVYLLSTFEGSVPLCMPYIDGCTTISRAARSGNAIFLFRVNMIVYALLLIWFWVYVKHWIGKLHGTGPRIAKVILWLGVTGALAMMVYIDFLGTTGDVNRFMRRYGILLFFTLTPLAQFLLYREHMRFKDTVVTMTTGALRFQFFVLLLMLMIALASVAIEFLGWKTYMSENIVEWNFSLLINLYFIGMFSLWRNFSISFSH